MSKKIPLTRGKVAIVDDDDFARLMQHKWNYQAQGSGYAARHFRDENGKIHSVLMHRLILDAGAGMEVDHINGDTLNNTRENLRLCTHTQNMHNHQKHSNGKTSRYKGVWWKRYHNKFEAGIRVNGKSVFLGRYASETDAALAYNQAATKFHGAFAKLNEVES